MRVAKKILVVVLCAAVGLLVALSLLFYAGTPGVGVNKPLDPQKTPPASNQPHSHKHMHSFLATFMVKYARVFKVLAVVLTVVLVIVGALFGFAAMAPLRLDSGSVEMMPSGHDDVPFDRVEWAPPYDSEEVKFVRKRNLKIALAFAGVIVLAVPGFLLTRSIINNHKKAPVEKTFQVEGTREELIAKILGNVNALKDKKDHMIAPQFYNVRKELVTSILNAEPDKSARVIMLLQAYRRFAIVDLSGVAALDADLNVTMQSQYQELGAVLNKLGFATLFGLVHRCGGDEEEDRSAGTMEKLRSSKPEDLDRLVKVLLAAFPHEKLYHFLFVHRARLPPVLQTLTIKQLSDAVLCTTQLADYLVLINYKPSKL